MSKESAMNFFLTVAKMREAQKEYFKTRDRGVLVRSKQLEQEVDGYVSRGMRYICGGSPHKEGDLFA